MELIGYVVRSLVGGSMFGIAAVLLVLNGMLWAINSAGLVIG